LLLSNAAAGKWRVSGRTGLFSVIAGLILICRLHGAGLLGIIDALRGIEKS